MEAEKAPFYRKIVYSARTRKLTREELRSPCFKGLKWKDDVAYWIHASVDSSESIEDTERTAVVLYLEGEDGTLQPFYDIEKEESMAVTCTRIYLATTVQELNNMIQCCWSEDAIATSMYGF